jgi:hypothetical protein
MLEKQRIHLEELIDELVRVELEVAKYFNTDKAGMAMKAREKAKDDIKEYLNFIQSYVGTLCAMTPGGIPNEYNNPMDYITREVEDDD